MNSVPTLFHIDFCDYYKIRMTTMDGTKMYLVSRSTERTSDLVNILITSKQKIYFENGVMGFKKDKTESGTFLE